MQPSPQRGNSTSILIVEDDPDNLILMSYQVSQLLHCSILNAPNGVTALSLAKTYLPDLILLDLMLPDMDGFEIARHLKCHRQTQHIPVVAVSAMARQIDRELALSAGCSEYLCKPYDLDKLEAILQSFLTLVKQT